MALLAQRSHRVPQQRPTAQKVRAQHLRDLVWFGVEARLCAENADGEDDQIYLFESIKRAGDRVGVGFDVVGVQSVELAGGAAGRLELVDHRRHAFVVPSEQKRLDLPVLGDSPHDRDTDLRAATEHQDPQPHRRIHAHRSSRVPIAHRDVNGSGDMSHATRHRPGTPGLHGGPIVGAPTKTQVAAG